MRNSQLAFVLAAGVLLGMPEPAGAQSTVPRGAGEWIRTEHASDDVQRTAELERITAPLPFFARGLARMLLKSSIRPPEVYVVHVREGEVSIRSDDAEPMILRVRTPQPADEDPPLGLDFGETGFVEYWQHGKKSRGTTRWQLSPDTTRLTIITTVLDDRFDGEFAYVANYKRRNGGEPVVAPGRDAGSR